MESLKEVLIRVENLTEEQAEERIKNSKELLSLGMSPAEVLVDSYGSDPEHLSALLDPVCV